MDLKKHFGKTYSRIMDDLESKGGLSFLVLDPPDRKPEEVGAIAKLAEECNFDAFAVGGSVGAQGELLDKTILNIKENSNLPVVLFPGNIATLSQHADAAYYMSMINSRDPYYISGAQVAAALPVAKMGLEAIPTTYMVFEPGRAVGWVGDAKLIPRDLPYLAAITALAGQLMGSHMVILESGSGADSPVPAETIQAIRKTIHIPIVVAGGVNKPEYAYESIKAGADILHIGTAVDEVSKDKEKARKLMMSFTDSVRKAGKEKLNK